MPANVFNIQIIGARDLAGRFMRLTEDFRDNQMDAANDLKERGVNELRDRAPYFRGDLQKAIDGEIVSRGRDIDIQFYVSDDVHTSAVRDVNHPDPAVYVKWVLEGRGPSVATGKFRNAFTDEPYLMFPIDPGEGSWIVATMSRGVPPNDFPIFAMASMEDDCEWVVRKMAARVMWVWG